MKKPLTETYQSMNLLCPNCQKQLAVPEQNAGQLMKCPLCGKHFLVPALPQTSDAAAESAIPSAIPFQAAPPSPQGPTTSPTPAQPDVLALSPQPATPHELPPRQDEAAAVHSTSPPFQRPVASAMSPPPPPTGYEPAWTIWLSRRVIRWFAPVALFLVLILMFFPWTGILPGGYPVYTQNALQMIWGGYSVDPVGAKVIGMDEAIHGAVHANWSMVFYLLLILAALVLAVTPFLQARITYPLPHALQRIWPWRTVLILVATLLAFLVLFSFLVSGSGLENAVSTMVRKTAPATSPEEQIKLGLELSRWGLSRTFWLHCAVFFHAVALAGAGLELWLERRGERPLPRLEVYW
jgi:hypothetical protein